MKVQTVYVSDDGARFDSAGEAINRDSLVKLVADIMLGLRPIPKDDGCRFANGGGYVQQDASVVKEAKRRLMEIAAAKLRRDDLLKEDVHVSWALRLLDGALPPVERALSRFYCMDERFREWGQPFYASHPDEAESQVEVGK